MLKMFANLPPRKRLGILAVLMTFIAIFAGSPFDKTKASVNIKELSLLSLDKISEVKVNDLADWLIKGKYDYRLVDLRDSKEYEKYSIPTSENIPVNELLKSDLARNEKIVLYSNHDVVSSQAWFLLKADDYKGVYILDGGLKSWEEQILFPKCTCEENPSIEQKQHHAKLAEVSKYFGGKLRSGTNNVAENEVKMPTPAAPKKITLKKAKGKKQREGC